MNKLIDLVKKNKVIFFILIALIVIALGIVGHLIIFSDKNLETDNKQENQEVIETDKTQGKEDIPTAPAKNTEDLVKSMSELKINALDSDKIEFSKDIDVKEGDKVAVWIYSQPKFLGYFEVIIKKGVKIIEGLEKALESISIESGEHNVAIVTEEGKSLGYIDVYIEKNKELTESKKEDKIEENHEEKQDEKEDKTESKTTTKEITAEKEISFKTTTEKEVNMLRGSKKVVQKGSKGIKEITYKVTYDASGKELSREKIKEKVTKEAVNQIEKVGTSDFNINSDTTRGSMSGPACTKDKTYDSPYDGALHCNDETYRDLEEFSATIMAGKIIVTKIGGNKLSKAIIAKPVNDYVFMGTYNGKTYYFDNRMGDGEPGTLTLEFCNEYGLSCGAW